VKHNGDVLPEDLCKFSEQHAASIFSVKALQVTIHEITEYCRLNCSQHCEKFWSLHNESIHNLCTDNVAEA
jgi:hypothetical protein